MSNAAVKSDAKNSKPKAVPTLVLEWIDQEPSRWEKEGTREEGRPVFLSSASMQGVLARSGIEDKEGNIVYIRFVKNAKSIYEEEQKKRNEEPNHLTDNIFFEHGVFSVRREGADINLYEYLKNCSFNRDSPVRHKQVQALFYEIKAEAQAEDDMKEFDDLAEAIDLVGELRTKDLKKTGYTFDEDRIDALISLTGIDVQKAGESYPEKFRALYSLAGARPAWFKKMADSGTTSVKIAIVQARELGVISLDGDTASVKDTSRVIVKLVGKTMENKISELTNYFISPAGKKDYEEVVIKTDAVKQLKLSQQ